MRVLGLVVMFASMAACSSCPDIIYDPEIRPVAGTPVEERWIRVSVPGGPATSVELPIGTYYKPVYSTLDAQPPDSSVPRKRHPSYLIRTLKILDGEPLPALQVTFVWVDAAMKLLEPEELRDLDRLVQSPEQVARLFLDELWWTRRHDQQLWGRAEDRFVDFGLTRVGDRPARRVAFVPTDPNLSTFWYHENVLAAVSPSVALIIEGTFHPEGQALEKSTVWPRVIQSVQFSPARPP